DWSSDVCSSDFIVPEHRPVALGAVAPANALNHQHITTRYIVLSVEISIRHVGRALDDCGKFAVGGSAVASGPVNVGGEPHAIAHRDHDALGGNYLVWLLLRERGNEG